MYSVWGSIVTYKQSHLARLLRVVGLNTMTEYYYRYKMLCVLFLLQFGYILFDKDHETTNQIVQQADYKKKK